MYGEWNIKPLTLQYYEHSPKCSGPDLYRICSFLSETTNYWIYWQYFTLQVLTDVKMLMIYATMNGNQYEVHFDDSRACQWQYFSMYSRSLQFLVHILSHHIAYLRVHSLASSLYLGLSVLYILAISGTSGSSGLGSVSSEQMDNNTAKEW